MKITVTGTGAPTPVVITATVGPVTSVNGQTGNVTITASGLGGLTTSSAASTVVTETSYGQASAVGAATTYAREDHTHGSPALTSSAPATTHGIGTAAALGAATTPAKADHVHPMAAAGAPAASAVTSTQTTGVATTFAASDHVHAREGFGAVTAQTTFGASSGNGSAATVAHSDHTHGTPSTAATTSTAGIIQLDGTATDIQPLGTQAAGATGKAADAGHIHPTGASLAKTSTTTVTNTTTETVLHTLTIPANDAIVGGAYILRTFGQATWPITTVPTITLRLRIGGLAGTAVATVVITCPSTAGSAKGWTADADITLTAIGASANWRGSLSTNNAIATAVQDKADASGAGVTLTSTSSQDLVITAQWSAAASGNTITCTGGYGYKIR